MMTIDDYKELYESCKFLIKYAIEENDDTYLLGRVELLLYWNKRIKDCEVTHEIC